MQQQLPHLQHPQYLPLQPVPVPPPLQPQLRPPNQPFHSHHAGREFSLTDSMQHQHGEDEYEDAEEEDEDAAGGEEEPDPSDEDYYQRNETTTPTSAQNRRPMSHLSTMSTPSVGGSSVRGRRSPNSGRMKKTRITLACDCCRRRKRKCDGTQPICMSCEKLSLPCSYQSVVKKRGPPPGVVKRLRQEVNELERELTREKRIAKYAKVSNIAGVPEARARQKSGAIAAAAAPFLSPSPDQSADDTDPSSLTALSLSSAANSSVRNDTYLSTYFGLLNNTMFPFLTETEFYAELKRYADDPTIVVPMSWNLRYASALSVGAMIYGDVPYAQGAARVARHAASQLFDQPDPLVVRGMLVLAFHCLSTNQQSRAACYLAVATRMCDLVEISPEIPPLATFMEDMLCGINWWYTGFDILPPGGFRANQDATYPQDKLEFEAIHQQLLEKTKKVEQTELGNSVVGSQLKAPPGHSDFQSAAGAGASGNESSSSAPSSSSSDRSSPPPQPDDDDASLRWELLKVMCFTSGTRGQMNKAPNFSLYKCLVVLVKALISPLTTGAIRTLILYFKVVCLKMLAATEEDHKRVLHNANLCTEAAALHDVTHCPFYSLCFHVIAQVHLSVIGTGPESEQAEMMLASDLDLVEKVARKWEFGLPMLSNLQARILAKYAHSKPQNPELLALVEAGRAAAQNPSEAASSSTSSKRTGGGGLSAAQLARMNPNDRQRASKIFTNTTVPAVLEQPPSIVDTLNSLNDQFSRTLRINENNVHDLPSTRRAQISQPLTPVAQFPPSQFIRPNATNTSSAGLSSSLNQSSAKSDSFRSNSIRPRLDEFMQIQDEEDRSLAVLNAPASSTKPERINQPIPSPPMNYSSQPPQAAPNLSPLPPLLPTSLPNDVGLPYDLTGYDLPLNPPSSSTTTASTPFPFSSLNPSPMLHYAQLSMTALQQKEAELRSQLEGLLERQSREQQQQMQNRQPPQQQKQQQPSSFPLVDYDNQYLATDFTSPNPISFPQQQPQQQQQPQSTPSYFMPSATSTSPYPPSTQDPLFYGLNDEISRGVPSTATGGPTQIPSRTMSREISENNYAAPPTSSMSFQSQRSLSNTSFMQQPPISYASQPQPQQYNYQLQLSSNHPLFVSASPANFGEPTSFYDQPPNDPFGHQLFQQQQFQPHQQPLPPFTPDDYDGQAHQQRP